jgi:hypothetical protein
MVVSSGSVLQKSLLLCSLTAGVIFFAVGVLVGKADPRLEQDNELLLKPHVPQRRPVVQQAGGTSQNEGSRLLGMPAPVGGDELQGRIEDRRLVAGSPGPFATMEDDLVKKLTEIAVDNAVLATSASREFAKVLANWICHVKKLGMTNVIIFALDESTALQAESAGVAYVLDRGFERTDGSIGTFASKGYLQAVYSKTRHQQAVLGAGFHLFFSDTDIPWTHNWMPEVASWASFVCSMFDGFVRICVCSFSLCTCNRSATSSDCTLFVPC